MSGKRGGEVLENCNVFGKDLKRIQETFKYVDELIEIKDEINFAFLTIFSSTLVI